MTIPGYAGRILHVDLTTGGQREKPLDENLVRKYVGGWGIQNQMAYDLIPPEVDPLSPENWLIVGTGPFVGTGVPGSSQVLVTTKYPLNGVFATAAGAGAFALRLKSAGYDHVLISGRAATPSYLLITEHGAEVRDARHLQGKDTFETDDMLRSLYEPCGVIAGNPAGEHHVRFSIAMVDKFSSVGKGGLPAVMQSKNLKAIVAVQGHHGIQIADRRRLVKLLNSLHDRIMRWPGRKALIDTGMTALDDEMATLHRHHRQPLACPSCPLADKECVRLMEGPYAGLTTYMPHVKISDFNGVRGFERYSQSVKYYDALNRYGLCRQSFVPMFDWLLSLFEQGIITEQDTGGVKIENTLESVLEIARLTTYRQGFGNTLAEGPVAAALEIGRGAIDHLEHVKGHGIVRHPREAGLGTMEFEEIVNPRGSHVASGGSPAYNPGQPPQAFARHAQRMGASPEAIGRAVGETDFNPARFTCFSEDWFSLFNCVALCNRAQVNRFYSAASIAEFYTIITGMETSPEQLMEVAERSWNLGKLLNTRAGFGRKDDRPPAAWFKPWQEDGQERHMTDYFQTTHLAEQDVETLLDEYYEARGWDPETGNPTDEKLQELGLPTRSA
jgi:aldehyde:ferredoxin oxidoreductase